MTRPMATKWPIRPATILWLLLALALLWPAIRWGLLNAVWQPDLDACREARGSGACWGVIAEKYRMMLFGRYPFDAQWRPALATLLIVGVLLAACWRRLWRVQAAWAGTALLALAVALMHGGFAGLEAVPTKLWGGLPLTLLVSLGSTLLAFPFAIVLAVGRRSGFILVRQICTLYIELIRGVPLISLLFMATFLFPLMLPPGWRLDVLPRIILTVAGFAAAYLAEVIRGGLQAVPSGQMTAALAIGLTRWQALRHIVLPQALRHVLPALVNSFIGIFKDSSLISIVSLHELTGALAISLGGDADWRSFYLEGYLFIALIYWAFCYGLSRAGRQLESVRGGRRQQAQAAG